MNNVLRIQVIHELTGLLLANPNITIIQVYEVIQDKLGYDATFTEFSSFLANEISLSELFNRIV